MELISPSLTLLVCREMLHGVYDRIRQSEFRPGSDHVTQVMKVQQTIVSKCPNLALPYRRLVCYCRLYEVTDPSKKDRPGENSALYTLGL